LENLRVGPTRQPALFIVPGPMCQSSSPTRRPCRAQRAMCQLPPTTLSLPPSAVRSSPALHSVLLCVTSFRQHRSPGTGPKPPPARAVSSSSLRRRPPQAAHGAALPSAAISVSRSQAALRRRSCDVLATLPPRRSRTTLGHRRNKPRPRLPPKLKLKPSSSPIGELASVFLLRCRALPPLTSFCVAQATGALNLGAQPSPSGSLFLLRRSPAMLLKEDNEANFLVYTSIHVHISKV
jgi:hypothetical protein